MERLGLLMAGGSLELEHLLPNSPDHGGAHDNTYHANMYGDFVMEYFDMFGAMGSAE
jgi:hypothetical protein